MMSKFKTSSRSSIRLIACFAALIAACRLVAGQTTITPWVPLFKGIDHAIGTNIPGAGALYQNHMVIHAIRVDLTDPDIKLLPTPRITSYVEGSRETAGITVSAFLKSTQAQLAINANFFQPNDYYEAAGTPIDVDGLLISHGVVVSRQENALYSCSYLFDVSNNVTVIHTNWPPAPTGEVYNAITGTYPLVIGGVNIGRKYLNIPDPTGIHGVQPRTAYGVSKDHKTLYLLTLDGRQSGYSDGGLDWETAGWLLAIGAYEGDNMDGGGSTTLVMQTSSGAALELNKSSAVAGDAQHRERTVGAALSIFAKPLPGFFNNVTALADDDAATITWSTISPSTTQLQYGLSTNLDTSTALQTALATNHAVLLTNLYPNATYYFQALATIGASQYTSPVFSFVTSNYVTTNVVIDLPSPWSYSTADLDGVNWTAPSYNDSGWNGPGPGILLLDTQRPLNPLIQPQGTILPPDTSTGFPFITYYFRTHFPIAKAGSGASIIMSGYVDDGAVVYLNGNEITRLRMDPAPTVILNSTLAAGFPCSGDATCEDDFALPFDVGTNLVTGDNVMAVEVHNYNAQSPDITFGAIVTATERAPVQPLLSFTNSASGLQLSWTQGGFTLQQAPSINGPWTATPGPVFVSPYMATNAAPSLYYRLQK
jgi:hypothetical protein